MSPAVDDSTVVEMRSNPGCALVLLKAATENDYAATRDVANSCDLRFVASDLVAALLIAFLDAGS